MFRKIVVPVDGSELASLALWQVQRLLPDEPAEVVLIHAVDPGGSSDLDEERRLEGNDRHPAPRLGGNDRHLTLRLETGRRHLKKLSDLWRRYLGDASQVTLRREVEAGEPTVTILALVARERPDLVVLASHGGGGPGRWLRGSVAERLLRRCPTPLLICTPQSLLSPETGGYRFQRVLVPLDGSRMAAEVLPMAATLAREHGALLVLLTVEEEVLPDGAGEVPRRAPRRVEESLRPFTAEARALGAEVHAEVVVSDDSAAEVILDYVEREGVDLVAMTTHGRSGFPRWLYGSVAEKVLRHCRAPLLVQRLGGFLPGGEPDRDRK